MTEPSKILSALTFDLVSLADIAGLHPSVAAHRERADVVDGTALDLSAWTDRAIEALRAAAPPLLVPRTTGAHRKYLIVGGAHVVAALRRVLPADAVTPALVLPLWLRSDRLVELSVAHQLAPGALHAASDTEAAYRLYQDACTRAANPFKEPPSRSAFRSVTRLKLPKP